MVKEKRGSRKNVCERKLIGHLRKLIGHPRYILCPREMFEWSSQCRSFISGDVSMADIVSGADNVPDEVLTLNLTKCRQNVFDRKLTSSISYSVAACQPRTVQILIFST